MTLPTGPGLEAASRYIHELDLIYITDAMCSERYPLPRWTPSDAAKCCHLYKRFLFLSRKYRSVLLVPTRAIDEFWHNHILHTQRYFHDCKQIFGHYLHHEPASPDEDMEKLIDSFLITKQLYRKEFGEELVTATMSRI